MSNVFYDYAGLEMRVAAHLLVQDDGAITDSRGRIYGYNSILRAVSHTQYKMFTSFAKANHKALRKPARLRRKLYGKAKKPYTIIHDCITQNF